MGNGLRAPARSASQGIDAESGLSPDQSRDLPAAIVASPAHSASGEISANRRLWRPGKSDADAAGSGIDSGSDSSVPSPPHCQVFLSFSRADDDETEFADRLYQALVDAGFHVLKDHYELDAAGQLRQELRGLIEHCNIFIPIISITYTYSERCLQELTWMVENRRRGGRAIEPIYYHYIGSFFSDNLFNKWEPQIIQQWRDALKNIGEAGACYLQEYFTRHPRQLIPDVVEWITGKPCKASDLPASNSLVGIDHHLEAITGLLDLGAEGVKAIGIYGGGGIGKTTLVKTLYNRIVDRFDHASFLSCPKRSILYPPRPDVIQARLVAHLSARRGEVGADACEGGTRELHTEKKVLIVLDVVHDVEQLRALAHLDSLGAGSRIIIAGRDRHVLEEGCPLDSLYEVTDMHPYNAFLLLCKHAFRQDSPPDEFASISWDIVKVTGLNPSSIVVTGLSLYGTTKPEWERRWLESGDVSRQEIHHMLSEEIDNLHVSASLMFLDVACFLVGTDVRFAMCMWWGDGLMADFGMRTLQKLSLIKIGDDNKMWMPNHVRDLGRGIVLQEYHDDVGHRRRLWGEDALHVIKTSQGTWTVEAICLDYGSASGQNVVISNGLKQLPMLRFLDLADANLCGEYDLGRLGNLRWLGWHGNTRLNILSLTYPHYLSVLDLSKSAVNETWDGWSPNKEARNLKVIDLTSCHQLARTPDLSSFPHIEMLILKDCTALSAVDTSIGHLKKLRTLDLRNCVNLEKLPDEIGFLSGLEDLLIDGCPVREIPISDAMKKLRTVCAKSCRLLTEIPQLIGDLVGLEELLLDGCESLTELPTAIGQLKHSLKVLSLSHARVVRLPDTVGSLSKLEVLNIDHCPIRSLPSSFGKLERLEVLNASRCLNLSGEISCELGQLKHLRILRLDHTSITSIPRSIVGLSHLQTLDLEGCVKLMTLPELPSCLINLKVTLTASKAVPNLTELINLRQLEIINCSNLDWVQAQEKPEEPSSSAVPIQPGYEYEVFLSFRGPDTRTGFTDSLYCSLDGAGIRTFRDNNELRVGEEIGPEILRAIEQSRIFIPIFSKGYASSKWCMKEVAKMVECMSTNKQIIIPIFYDVAPDHVQHQTGTYAEAFSVHEESEKFTAETIKEWRDALVKVSSLKGRGLTNNGYTGEVIREVVSEVFQRLKKPYLDVTQHLVGVEEHMEKVIKLLEINNGDDVKVVGICGMGGIGKTTIAKCIYNQLRDQFECCSFLKDVREASLSKGVVSLQRQLISDVLRRKCEEFPNSDAGKEALGRRLCAKKVLILLDDVNQPEQLNNLVGHLKWLGQGSRIIVTTREVDSLRGSDVFISDRGNNALVYEVGKMHPHNAFLLFCKHAFRQDFPVPDLITVSWKIVEATGRLPLAIVSIGSYLSFQKEEEVWEEALSSLKTKTNILDKLRISYDALSSEEKEVFLDIVCLFSGMDRRIPVHVWKARDFTPATAVTTLVLRSVIRIGENNDLLVHDLYRDLGRAIIRDESRGELGRRSRLWRSEDAIRVLKKEKGTEYIKAINLDHGMQSETCCFSSPNFKNLPNLWFLGLGNANLDGNFRGHLSDLRWLSHHGHDLLNIPDGLNLDDLIVLDLSRSNVSENWNGWNSLKDAEKLEVLNLSSCHRLASTPNFPLLPRMKRLILEGCRGLVDVGPSIVRLEALEFLDVRNCSSLVHLPEEVGSLGALEELLLDGSSVQEVPLSRNMRKLKILSAKSCKSLTHLQHSVDCLPLKLTKLILDNCDLFTVIPHSIGQLSSLTDLSLSRSSTIIVPESIRNLCNLKVFNINHCPVRKLPHSLWKLEKLEVISASGCVILEWETPPEIENLVNLRILRLDQTSVSSIPPAIERLRCLTTLDLKECNKLRALPNLPSSLVNLKVTCMDSVTIPNLPHLVHLKELEVSLHGENARVPTDVEKFLRNEKFVKLERFTITIT